MKRMVTEEQFNKIDGETPESLSVDGNNIILEKKNGDKLTAEFSSGGKQLYQHSIRLQLTNLDTSTIDSFLVLRQFLRVLPQSPTNLKRLKHMEDVLQ